MADAYKVSVLTPVHNTKSILLERALHSLKRQTFGFERLQWVVVMHNCTDEIEESTRSLLNGLQNVTLVKARKPETGISYARNMTLEYASGEWVFFLDGDDEMKPDCIKRSVEGMEETQADMGIYGAEILAEKSRYLLQLPQREQGDNWLQANDPSIVEGLYICGLALWTKCFRRSFLQDTGLRFDESLKLGEDFIFTAQSAAIAKRITLLPGFCGYRYYMGRGMAAFIQGQGSSPDSTEAFRAADALADLLTRLYQETREAGLLWDTLIWMIIYMNVLTIQLNGNDVVAHFLKRVRPLIPYLTPPALMDEKRDDYVKAAFRNTWKMLKTLKDAR